MMSDWFYRLFHYAQDAKPIRHCFGRGINARLHPRERELFEEAMNAFSDGKITEAYEHYLRSLENFNGTQSNHNIALHYEEETLHFELYQGTAVIRGSVTDKQFEAHAVITSRSLMDVAIKRHILERNDLLTYAYYYTHGEDLLLKIYLDNTTMTPQKIFYPLRELALNADYEKEYLHYYYKQERLIEVGHLKPIDTAELQIKYEAMRTWIEKAREDLKHLPANDNNSTVSFTALSLIFQIDYLLLPQNDIAQEIIEKVTSFFTDDERLVEQKNDELLEFIEKLQKLDFETFARQCYKARYTFAPMDSASIEELNLFVETSLEKMRWFRQHRYTHIVFIIYRYIALYMLYNYGLHPSYRALLHLLVEVHNSDFFTKLGYAPLYSTENNRFDREAIINAIDDAIKPYQKQFAHLEPFGKELNYTTLEEFSHSFYLHLKNLNYIEL